MSKTRGFLFWLVAPLLLGLAMVAVAATALKIAIQRGPGDVFTKEGIMKILARESVVFYADGKTKVGTFFEGAHRDYVVFDSIPRYIVDALVSAEDHNYWNHGGVDYKGLAYAMLDNLKSMRLKRGGSTLTQQTSKNLFGRRGRTLRGKIGETVNAYRLERFFTKQEILEFYLNQFYVSGNGHGVQIAARYFFNKDLAGLDLLECAFIAGSVKGPNQYNPFIQDTPEKKDAALQRGRYRVAYVLKQMLRQKKISEADYQKALARKLEFRRGDFRFRLSTNMVKVKQLLDAPEMQEILAASGVDDFMTAGLQITTTLDPDLQKSAEYAVGMNLARLDMLLKGYRPPRDTAPELLSHFIPGEFHTGRVEETEFKSGAPVSVRVRFGSLEGRISQSGLEGFFRVWNRNRSGSDTLPSGKAMSEFASAHLRQNMPVFCAIPYFTPRAAVGVDLATRLELIQKPELQGAAQVVKDGKVLANMGGFGNTGYDRVNQARRQFGSAFKPLVYAAAMELGWKPLDPVINSRQLFRVGNVFYFPKPDHTPEDTVSIAWAGRRSENVGSIHLLYHLFDKTDFARFWEACREIGLAPENFAMRGDFEVFVRDSLGLVLDSDHMRELRYRKATADLAIDLTFDGRLGEGEKLRALPYGAGFSRERQKYQGSTDAEDQVRTRLLERSYLDFMARAGEWRKGYPGNGDLVLARHVSDGRLGIFKRAPDSAWQTVPREEASLLGDSLLVEGEIALEALQRLNETLRSAKEEGNGTRYTPENLFASPDFRALAALRYIVAFSRRVGIVSPLDPVLSFPLGVNVITLGEAVDAYQALQSGNVYKTHFGHSQMFIQSIATADGRLLFEDEVEPRKVISDRTRFALEAILGSVVSGGTGQRIGRELRIAWGGDSSARVAVPAFGKTGTTNDYRNGAFIGYIAAPKGQGKGFDAASGYTLGAYTGFDDNVPMVRGAFRGTGAGVALTGWLEIAKALVDLREYSLRVDTLDLEAIASGHAPLFQNEKYRTVPVSRRTGLPVAGDGNEVYAEDLTVELGADGKHVESGAVQFLMREE